MATRHVGGRPALVDEDQPLGIEVELSIEPFFPALQDVGAVVSADAKLTRSPTEI
jgi:hypothetical protein